MNRVVNIFTFILLTVYSFMSVVLVFDLSISNFHLRAMPFQFEILTAISITVFLLGVLRIRRRWQGIRDMNDFSNFIFTSTLPLSVRKLAIVFSLLEVSFMIVVSILFVRLSFIEKEMVLPMIAVLSVLAIEGLFFTFRLIQGGNAFKVGLGTNELAWFDREMHIIYFDSLRRVELFQGDLINFSYKGDLNLSAPIDIIPKESRQEFKEKLIDILTKRNVYIDDAFRNWE